MVVGGEISLNCYNSRNICHSHNVTFFFTFFTLAMIKTPIQVSVQSLVRKCAKSAKLP